jgi:proteic killer suppression protein
MKIKNVIHKGLRRFIEDDDGSGLPPAVGPKVRKIVSFLQDMHHESELRSVPHWKAHQMSGDRKGAWSLFVTKNWRITFQIAKAEIEIINLDFEDYH